jgi:PLP dependent protein
MDLHATIAANLQRVGERIERAALRAGRSAGEIRLVAVTKYMSLEATRALVKCGCLDLGESRPQTLWEKGATLAELPVRWHMIGHLQRNKVKRTLPYLALLHSGDSLRLLEEANREAGAAGRKLDVLLEVNVSGDEAKHGFQPEQVEPLLPQIAALEHVAVRGLMTMAALEGGPERARRDFAALRELRDRLKNVCPASIKLSELSMGMSGDFEVAVQEGATMVRVGTAIFGSR